MSRLTSELQRLYFLPGLDTRVSGVVGADGRIRVATMGFTRAADWKLAARLYQSVQEDEALPAPAVSISGNGGYQMWFSLGEPVPVDQVQNFLRFLQQKYLSDLPPGHLTSWPALDGGLPPQLSALPLPPALDASSGKWSAFIEPGLGSMFIEEPGLEMAPNEDRQADLLADLRSIRRDEFLTALKSLAAQSGTTDTSSAKKEEGQPAGAALVPPRTGLSPGGGFTDPKQFLLAVMNDPAACAEHRIEAAKALLPYFHKEQH